MPNIVNILKTHYISMREVLILSPISGEVTEEIMLRNFPEVTQLLAVDLRFRKKKSYTPDNVFPPPPSFALYVEITAKLIPCTYHPISIIRNIYLSNVVSTMYCPYMHF